MNFYLLINKLKRYLTLSKYTILFSVFNIMFNIWEGTCDGFMRRAEKCFCGFSIKLL